MISAGGCPFMENGGEAKKIYDLVEVVEQEPESPPERETTREFQEEWLLQEVRSVAEKVARELFPAIAERVIREEIEKLKRGSD
jgi:hypothetical protein